MLFRKVTPIILLVSLLSSGNVFAVTATLPDQVDFNEHIRPIFTHHCTACHGGVKQAAELSFVYQDTLENVIEPGDPNNSYLLMRILDEDEESRMPPADHGPRLSEEEVALLREWIDQGAKWHGHWAYELPHRQASPAVSQSNWARQPMDSFVLQQLDQRGITPAPDERPERWLRRVTLDLIGLPPSLEERKAFLDDHHDRGEPAFAAVVDRLLESPRFGERWASVWLDQVRYADSRGQGEDSPRVIWKYRDWVIDALNKDMSYDQFTIRQIAGDLLPDCKIDDQIATAVHRLTHSNEEGGTDDEEFRIAAVLDRVNTTWQTWQGTTFGCVQCHSHPYDPFLHEDYYKFVAFFNNTADCDLDDDWPLIDTPTEMSDYPRMTELNRKIEQITRSLWETMWEEAAAPEKWTPLRIDKVKTNNRVKLIVEPQEEWDEYRTEGTISSGTMVDLQMPLPKTLKQVTGVRITALPLDPIKAVSESEWGFVMSNIRADLIVPDQKSVQLNISRVYCDEPFPKFDPHQSLNKEKEGFAAFSRIHYLRQAVLVFDTPSEVPQGTTLRLRIKHNWLYLAAFPLLTRRAHFAASDDPSLMTIGEDELLSRQQEELSALEEERQAIPTVETPILRERESNLSRPTHVFTRGLFLTKGDEVDADVPRSLLADVTPMKDRLSLAQWLVSDENPLTARVAVNRFWARMFGVGLVATEEDFGSTGDTPSHPELFDDLAVRFRVDYGWSVKKLLREIALSSTYRQSSRIRPELLEADANNRWLARGPRHSLPAETLRDQMLAISGLLSNKMYGEPVQPPLPPGVWKARRGEWNTPKPGDEDRYRRSVYTYVKRSVPYPMHVTFDAPSRDVCQPKRLRTNTPLQSLILLNDSGFVECAQTFAQNMREHCDNPSQQIEYGLLAATCREPSEGEVERLLKLYDQVTATSGPEIALQTVASVLLNLDEVITK